VTRIFLSDWSDRLEREKESLGYAATPAEVAAEARMIHDELLCATLCGYLVEVENKPNFGATWSNDRR